VIVEVSVKIDADVEKVSNFFNNLEDYYLSWHPKDHVFCRWTKVCSHDVGLVACFEEILDGKPFKIE